MDFILRYLNARGLLIAGGAAALVAFVVRFAAVPGRWYEARMIARDRGATTLASDIAKDLDAQDSLRLRGLYRDVSQEIAAARARRRPVDALQRAADAALALDAPGTRRYAFESLNKLRLAIPQPFDAVRPASGGDEPSDAPATPASTPARRARGR